jgi:hypothetical protein
MPHSDQRFKKFTITSATLDPMYFVPIDTIVYDVYCNQKLDYTLTLTDTAIYNNPNCEQEFPIKGIRFFITGYWCPTTWVFKDYTDCQSVFIDESCNSIEYEEPEPPCDDNTIYDYSVDFQKPVLKKTKQPGLCIRMNEVKANGMKWASTVDSAISEFIEVMKYGLDEMCVKKAIAKGKKVQIIVKGFTDPRAISNNCRYTGPDIDFKNNNITLQGYDAKAYLTKNNGVLKNGSYFRESGVMGNEMLSDLRAYHTAKMLDKIWIDSVDIYRTIKATGQLEIIAIGKGIDDDENTIAYENKRKVSVGINVPLLEGEKLAQFRPDAGTKSALKCISPCMDVNATFQSTDKESFLDTMRVVSRKIQETRKTKEKISTTITNRSNEENKNLATNEDVIEEDGEPLPPADDGEVGNCWALKFGSSTDYVWAQELQKELGIMGINTNITSFMDEKTGTTYYRVKAGCWQSKTTSEEAKQFYRDKIRNSGFTPKILKKNPISVKNNEE